MIKKTILTLALTAAAFAGGFGSNSNQKAQYLPNPDGGSNQYVICTASDTGSYYKAGKRIVSLLGQDRSNGKMLGYAATTDGSGMNYDLMSDGICNVAVMQGDHVAYLRGVDKSFFDGKAVIFLDRTENVQLIMRKGMDEDDLQTKGAKVLVGLASSGGAASYKNMTALESGYGKATIVYGDIDISALSDLAAGRIDGIIRTSHLDPTHDQLAKDVRDVKGIYFADLDDSNLNNKVNFGDGDVEIYKFVDTVVAKGFFDTEAETLETHVAIVIDKKNMSKKQKNKILRVITQNKKNLF